LLHLRPCPGVEVLDTERTQNPGDHEVVRQERKQKAPDGALVLVLALALVHPGLVEEKKLKDQSCTLGISTSRQEIGISKTNSLNLEKLQMSICQHSLIPAALKGMVLLHLSGKRMLRPLLMKWTDEILMDVKLQSIAQRDELTALLQGISMLERRR